MPGNPLVSSLELLPAKLFLPLFLITNLCWAQLNIVSIDPVPNANHVPLNTNIVLTFDQSISTATVNAGTIVVKGSQTGILSGVFSGGGSNTVTFNPDNDLRLGEVVSVTITTGLFSDLGLNLARGHTYSFTMVSGTPPASPLAFAHRNISTHSQPEDVKALDFDRDGDLDIITGNEGFDESTVFWENDGAQNFCSQRIAEFRNVEVYDIDGDGDFDSFGSTGAFATVVSWFENDGSNVNLTENVISGESPWTLTGGDLDSDGDIDLVAALIIPNRVRWFSNDGNGNFSTEIPITSTFGGGSDSYFYIVDINTDGAMDILAYHETDRNLVWYQNNGSQNFTEILIANTTNRQRLASGDLDDDGDIDIISTSNQNPGALSWYENDGNENFTERPVPVSITNSLRDTEITDVDGDLDMDILAGSFWYENDGAENFTENLISPGFGGTVNPFLNSLSYADLDGDNDMDLMTLSSTRISWQENGLFMGITSTSPVNTSMNVPLDANIVITLDQPIDNTTINTDNISIFGTFRGKLAGSFSGGGSNTITFNPDRDLIPGEQINVSINERLLSTFGHSLAITYGFSFTAQTSTITQPQFSFLPIIVHGSNSSGMDIADMDGDGDLDLLSCSFTELFWHENDGNGNFTSIPITTTATPTGVLAVDFNEDGHVDIVVDNNGNFDAKLYLNDGSQNFTESDISGAIFQEFTDISHDGDLDMLTLTRIDKWVSWNEAACGGYISSGLTVPRVQSRSVTSGDMDNDGDTDFVASSTSGPTFYENDGYLNFVNSNIDGNSTVNQTLADLDGDNDLDAIFAESFSAIVWYENRLTEASQDFGTRQEIGSLDQDPRDVYATDIDGDNDADVVAISRNDNKIVWYENRLNEPSQDFNLEEQLPLSAVGPVQVSSADMDGDGDMDVVVLSDQDDRLSWFRNSPSSCLSPGITVQPLPDVICEGTAHTISVQATGDPTLAYQWQKDGANITGANSSALTFSNPGTSDEGLYQCVISNPCGSITSTQAMLSIIENVSILTQPASQTVATGSDVTFALTATGDNISYQWQKDQGDISNANTANLLLSNVAIADAGNYACVVANTCNSQTSETAILTVSDSPVDPGNPGSSIIVYNAVAPDGDGKHDFLKIENIELLDNTVEIYNRWGEKVFEITGYDNQKAEARFDGRSNVGDQNDLIEGTYFYVINAGGDKRTGYLFLRR